MTMTKRADGTVVVEEIRKAAKLALGVGYKPEHDRLICIARSARNEGDLETLEILLEMSDKTHVQDALASVVQRISEGHATWRVLAVLTSVINSDWFIAYKVQGLRAILRAAIVSGEDLLQIEKTALLTGHIDSEKIRRSIARPLRALVKNARGGNDGEQLVDSLFADCPLVRKLVEEQATLGPNHYSSLF